MNTALIVFACLIATTGSFAKDLKTTFVQNQEIFVAHNSGPARAVTHDGVPKSLPVWSKDGSKIAFLERTDSAEALARLVVIDEDGVGKSSLLVRPAAKSPPVGMRFVENVEWVSDRKIAIGGSINPSQRETVVVDLENGQETNDIFDDAGGPGFSPDGNHCAYIGGMPHFAPEDTWHPELYIDDHLVFPPSRQHFIFLTAPQWSNDSDKLAIIAQDYVSKRLSVIVIHPPLKIFEIPLENSSNKVDLFNENNIFFIHSAKGDWKVGDDAVVPVVKDSRSDSLYQAKRNLSAEQEKVREIGGTGTRFLVPTLCAQYFAQTTRPSLKDPHCHARLSQMELEHPQRVALS